MVDDTYDIETASATLGELEGLVGALRAIISSPGGKDAVKTHELHEILDELAASIDHIDPEFRALLKQYPV